MAAPRTDDMPSVVAATNSPEAIEPTEVAQLASPPGHRGTKAEEAVEREWRKTGRIPSGYGVDFAYEPPIFKLPDETVKGLEADADAERARAAELEDQ